MLAISQNVCYTILTKCVQAQKRSDKMKRIFGDAREVLANPQRTALIVAMRMDALTEDEIKKLSTLADYFIWKRTKDVKGERKCKS